jgi:hypothetical protein
MAIAVKILQCVILVAGIGCPAASRLSLVVIVALQFDWIDHSLPSQNAVPYK